MVTSARRTPGVVAPARFSARRRGFRGWCRRGPALALVLALGGASGLLSTEAPGAGPGERPVYRTPFDIALLAGGTVAAVSDRTAGLLVLVDLEARRAVGEVPLRGEPTGLETSPQGSIIWCAEDFAGTVAEIDAATLRVVRRFAVGRRPLGVVRIPGRRLLAVSNSVGHDVSIVDLDSGRETARVAVPREPFFLAPLPDGEHVLAANLLPVGSPADDSLATWISLIGIPPGESGSPSVLENIALPRASTSVRQIVVSPDARWAYVVHTRGRINVPTTQLERGWISTNHLSVLDLGARRLHGSVVLDRVEEGASDPWGLALSADGKALWITLRGVHQLMRIDLPRLHRLLDAGVAAGAGTTGGPALANYGGAAAGARRRSGDASRHRQRLVDDLSALTEAGAVRRYPLPVRGPRGVSVVPGTGWVVVAGYFSGDLALVDPATGRTSSRIAVGAQPDPDRARLGEELFHDATISFQSWLSCSSCHPDRGRNDGLRWDLLNDGLGTPQMTRSLVKSHLVAPTTARGARPDFRASVAAGFRFLHTTPSPERVERVVAYLSSLEIEPSPLLAPDGTPTPAQERGRAIFEGKGGCTECHEGEIRTDMKPHDVGTAERDEMGGTRFYTPKLFELYRTAPFLHDARAATLRDVFRRWNIRRRHGNADGLSDEELDDLIQYLLTL